jgi:hypothetical protein
MKYNIGDIFLSNEDTLLYVASVSCGPSELLSEGETGIFYKLTFLNGRPAGKSTFVLEEKINQFVWDGVYVYFPVKE